MALPRSLLHCLCSVLLLIGAANALKLDVVAHTGRESQKKERCIRNFVGRDTLVVVTAIVGGTRGDGMMMNIHVRRNTPPVSPIVSGDMTRHTFCPAGPSGTHC